MIVPGFNEPSIEEFRCSMVARDGLRQEIRFRVVGGALVREGDRVLGREPRRIEVVTDPNGWLTQYPDQYGTGRGIVDGQGEHDFGWSEPGSFTWGKRLIAYSFGSPQKHFVRLEGHRPDADFDALGFCDWSEEPEN